MPKTTKATTEKPRPVITPILMELGAPDSGYDKAELMSVLVFETGGIPYAVGVEHTEGVVDCPRVTPLPSAPDGVAGLASVRGRMTVVMNFGARAADFVMKQRLILIKGESQLGLLADHVEGVIALERKKVRPVAHGKYSLTEQRAKFRWPARSYFKSGARRIPILDIDRLSE